MSVLCVVRVLRQLRGFGSMCEVEGEVEIDLEAKLEVKLLRWRVVLVVCVVRWYFGREGNGGAVLFIKRDGPVVVGPRGVGIVFWVYIILRSVWYFI